MSDELHLNCTWTHKNTKIVKFSASDEKYQWIFFVSFFNYELDIFYPFFSKMTKSHFKIYIYKFFYCTNCTNCTKLNWDTEIFDVSWVSCYNQLNQNSTEIRKSSTSVLSIFAFLGLHLELHQLHLLHVNYTNTEIFGVSWWCVGFFLLLFVKCNIVKNCECTECEFLRGLWESDIKNCNSGELHLTAPMCVFVSE